MDYTRVFFDCETTGINVYNSEIITGFFLREDTGETYYFKSQVNKWSDDAEAIHNISKVEMLSYPNKNNAYDSLIKWLPSKFKLICYANPQTELGYITFDFAILKVEIMDHLNIYHEARLPFKISCYSVHTLAKQCAKKGYFTPLRSDKNRESFKQYMVYKSLFNESYNEHDAKADVMAMIRIYEELNRLKNNNQKTIDKNQIRLL